LQLWDTAGQERFRSLTPSYVKNAAAIVFVYDITSIFYKIIFKETETFDGVLLWIKDVLEVKQGDPKFFIIANKTDLNEERKVQSVDGRNLADKNNAEFYEVSAKSGENVLSVFTIIAQKLAKCAAEFSKNPENKAAGNLSI